MFYKLNRKYTEGFVRITDEGQIGDATNGTVKVPKIIGSVKGIKSLIPLSHRFKSKSLEELTTHPNIFLKTCIPQIHPNPIQSAVHK